MKITRPHLRAHIPGVTSWASAKPAKAMTSTSARQSASVQSSQTSCFGTPAFDGLNQAAAVASFGHVSNHRLSSTPSGTNLAGRFLQQSLPPPADRHRQAGAGERDRDCSSYTSSSASDQRHARRRIVDGHLVTHHDAAMLAPACRPDEAPSRCPYYLRVLRILRCRSGLG
jgi:hypothetical protein